MINASIITLQKNNYLFWFIELTAIVNQKEHKKELKDISLKNDPLEPIDNLILSLKNKSEELIIKTNNPEIVQILSQYDGSHKITYSLDNSLSFDFSEMISFQEEENPFIPSYLNTVNTNFETDFEKHLSISIRLFQNFIYFQEHQDQIHETNLIKELKKKKLIPQDIQIEDIFCIIEDTLVEGE